MTRTASSPAAAPPAMSSSPVMSPAQSPSGSPANSPPQGAQRSRLNAQTGAQHDPTLFSRDRYEEFLDREASSPLQLATIARLKVWEDPEREYDLLEVMDLVHWAERKLVAPTLTPKHGPWQFLHASPVKARWLAAIVTAVVLLFWCYLTTSAVQLARPASVNAATGLLDTPGTEGGGDDGDGGVAAAQPPRVAATSSAVRLRDVMEYSAPTMSLEQLRHVEDVVLRHAGAFHVFRVGSVARLPSEQGVVITAVDGTTVRILPDGEVRFRRPFQTVEVVADMRGHRQDVVGSDRWAHQGVFRVVTGPPRPLSGTGVGIAS